MKAHIITLGITIIIIGIEAQHDIVDHTQLGLITIMRETSIAIPVILEIQLQ